MKNLDEDTKRQWAELQTGEHYGPIETKYLHRDGYGIPSQNVRANY
ncbi:MAG: hypothetical protein R3E08_04030 [Thiotrichaceae bacterium]